ncbi:MAG TPA: VWA domain-containing protein [Candidatus Dormibacteraeota bacterium]
MTFLAPLALIALAAIPALAGLYWLAQRRRRTYAIRFTNLALLGQVAPRDPGIRRHLPAGLFLLALSGLLVSFARPQAIVNVPKDQSTVMLVIDVSGSMQATDIMPDRLSAARNAARSLVDALPSNASVGLIAFSSRAFVVSPLSQDRDALKSALETLRAQGGTAIGDALNLAIDQVGVSSSGNPAQGQPHTMIVLLTDGVSNVGSPAEDAAARAAAAHIPIQTIGIGQRGGAVFVRGQDVGGVDEQALQSIAQTTSGQYFFASEAGQLQRIYSKLGGQFGWRQEKQDLTVPIAVAGTLLLVACAGLSLRWFRLLP